MCQAPLSVTEDQKSAKCQGARTHCFDFSREGYLSLSGTGGGDSKEAVAARHDFLYSGYYEKAAEAICQTVNKYANENAVIIDAGCGEGYYTSRLARQSAIALGFDLSKHACLCAAKQAKKEGAANLLFATASVFKLPVKSGVANAVVNVFAPCAEDEYCRVLSEGGYLFVVGAGKDHLMGLKRALYEQVYENTERADLPQKMEHVETVVCSYEVNVKGAEHIEALFSMTPYYWRTSEEDKQKLVGLSELTTQIEFEIKVYKK
ncbi:MAG: methyltransferase domain-containing protein [Clostridia bacterium]|nr:methyltransferase domain-containing protein [Clostridia bacterium]